MREKQFMERVLNMEPSRIRTLELVFLALFIAFTAVATAIHIPGPYGSYFNLGEVAIYLIALLCGPLAGAVAGSIGSALTDVLLGYSIWAPFTFIIKGVEGFLVGRLGRPLSLQKTIGGVAVGGIWMISGYVIVTAILYSWPAALPEAFISLAQVVIGGLVGIPLALKLNRALSRRGG